MIVSVCVSQVRISVQASRCHSDSLHMEVVSNKPHQPSQPQQPSQPKGRSQLVQEVLLQAEASQRAQDERSQGPQLSREEREFCQTARPSLYSVLEEVRELALQALTL